MDFPNLSGFTCELGQLSSVLSASQSQTDRQTDRQKKTERERKRKRRCWPCYKRAVLQHLCKTWNKTNMSRIICFKWYIEYMQKKWYTMRSTDYQWWELIMADKMLFKPCAWGNFSYLLFGAHDQQLGAEQDQLPWGSTGTSSGNCQDRNLHGSRMSHAVTTSPKPSFQESWRAGDTVVSIGNAGWTTSKSGHPCVRQNCSPVLKDWTTDFPNYSVIPLTSAKWMST